MGLSAVVATTRAAYIATMDHSYYKAQSRQRYLDKQVVYFKELQEQNKAHNLAALTQEYDPVAMRVPFGEVDRKWRL